ncbi:hypothetical protein [Polymorphobacter megasporae]|uniref:hypothetical protein n=1 Tax=Glacieibacterium megasporae TaxID=2835787 RepID=UPI001C1DEB68|nr:hypothetical protein [Polymorphobacter megasporae]UAJ11062.1 hypothetical protein KTC28_04950 [Polymorphobacter megasporae]
MASHLHIGLNLHTALLLNLLTLVLAVAVTCDPRSAAERIAQALVFFATIATIAMVMASLPHEPLF